MVNSLGVDDLRKMSKDELSKAYDITAAKANSLFCAINPIYYTVLTNNGLSIKQMAQQTGLNYETVLNYRSALIKAGLVDSRVPYGRVSELDVVSAIRGDPKTYQDIAKATGRTVKQVSTRVTKLKLDHTVLNVRFRMGRSKNPAFKLDKLVGSLSRKTMAYLPGEEKLLGLKVANEISQDLDTSCKRTLLPRLKRFMPKEAYDVVYCHVHRDQPWAIRKYQNEI